MSSCGRARWRSNGRARRPGIPLAVRGPSRLPRSSVLISAGRARSGRRYPRQTARTAIFDRRGPATGPDTLAGHQGRAPVSFSRLRGLLLKAGVPAPMAAH
jgi:hypothetical protein